MAWLLPTEGPALPQVRKKEQWELGEGCGAEGGGGPGEGWEAAPFLMDALILGCPPPPPRACSSPLMGRTSSWVCEHYTICLGFYTFSIKTQKEEKCTHRAHQQKKKTKKKQDSRAQAKDKCKFDCLCGLLPTLPKSPSLLAVTTVAQHTLEWGTSL